ncbi:MAG: protein translocase SEC61 complex subunit gamma [Candidatus Aenigmatarchaeota archaeon]|nr:MAG: protein translocase SEC61 complex subunit gamma [Candidatus Aenigmarchaeota archaeon]
MDIKESFRRYVRVLQVARKPSKDEFVTTGKMSALGIFIIGTIGFLIFMGFVIIGL